MTDRALKLIESKRKPKANPEARPMAQNGTGFRYHNPFKEDAVLNTLKAAGASYLSSKHFYEGLYSEETPEERQRKSQKQAMISGALGAANSLISQFSEARDYKEEMRRIAERKAMDYARTPRDAYAYNSQLDNPYNNVAYEKGGAVKPFKKKK